MHYLTIKQLHRAERNKRKIHFFFEYTTNSKSRKCHALTFITLLDWNEIENLLSLHNHLWVSVAALLCSGAFVRARDIHTNRTRSWHNIKIDLLLLLLLLFNVKVKSSHSLHKQFAYSKQVQLQRNNFCMPREQIKETQNGEKDKQAKYSDIINKHPQLMWNLRKWYFEEQLTKIGVHLLHI